jgi:hypothetical protein
MNSRQKGARGEREARDAMKEILLCEARRGQQFSGGKDSPDVVHSVHGVHVEVKRVEKFNVYDAIEQATEDAGEEQIPTVMHRRNGKEWLLVCRFADLPKLASRIHFHMLEKASI